MDYVHNRPRMSRLDELCIRNIHDLIPHRYKKNADPDHRQIQDWNDSFWTTKKKVLAVLRKARENLAKNE